jgi:formylglycine-generating enzyme required for sulfatase activity
MHHLGLAYEQGRGVPVDKTEAVKWYRKGAALRNDSSKQRLKELGLSDKSEKATQPTRDESWENTLGMKFVPVPGTAVLFSVWETRVQDFRAYAAAKSAVDGSWKSPGFAQGDDHPVVNVSWTEAQGFCQWLTEKERAEGKIRGSQSYRLPQDWEWSVAVGLNEARGGTPKDKSEKIAGVYPWGTRWPPPRGAGNYNPSLNVDNFDRTSPVASFAANRYGIYDLGGNAFEWCEDWYDSDQKFRVLRGASWFNGDSDNLSSSSRSGQPPDYRAWALGFRCVLVVGSSP